MTKYILALILMLFCINLPTKAATLDFEDTPVPPNINLTNYGGFEWTNTIVQEALGNSYAYNFNHLNIAAKLTNLDSLINLSSIGFQSRNWKNSSRVPFTVTVEGYLKGNQVNSIAVDIPGENSFTTSNISLNNIDEFRIIGPSVWNNYSIDNISYIPVNNNQIPTNTPVPEPSSMILGVIGLSSLFVIKRRNSLNA